MSSDKHVLLGDLILHELLGETEVRVLQKGSDVGYVYKDLAKG